jgi:hypothetical protein
MPRSRPRRIPAHPRPPRRDPAPRVTPRRASRSGTSSRPPHCSSAEESGNRVLPIADGPYARWVTWLDAFRRGDVDDPVGLAPMTPEQFGPAVFGKLALRCAGAFDARLALWASALQRDLDRANAAGDISAALQNARRRGQALHTFTSSSLIYADLATTLQEALDKTLEAANEALEASARRLGTSGEAVLRIIRASGVSRRPDLDLGVEHQPRVASGPRTILLGKRAAGA